MKLFNKHYTIKKRLLSVLIFFFMSFTLPVMVYFVVSDYDFATREIVPKEIFDEDLTHVQLESSFEELREYVENPFMGAVPSKYIGIGGIHWSDVERNKGIYDFSSVSQSGEQTMLAFVMDMPRNSNTFDLSQDLNIPRWLFDEMLSDAGVSQSQVQSIINQFNSSGAKNTDISNVGTLYRMVEAGHNQVGFSPNYSNSKLINYHRQALRAVAERFDNERTYCMIMGSIGHWGEMHTYFVDRGRAGSYPSKDIGAQYYNEYAQFENTFVSSRQPREVARDHRFGLHNHAFGHPRHTYDWFVDWFKNGYTCYYTGDSHPAMPEFWKYAASGAEFLSTGDNRFLMDSNIEGTIQQANDTYLTWLIRPWVQLTGETQRNFNRLLSKIGYRFVIMEAKGNLSGNTFSLETKWKNTGTAPFYKDWPIVVRIGSAESVIGDANSFLPGEEKSYVTEVGVGSLASGTYDVLVGIVNPDTGSGAINLAVRDIPSRDKLYTIGNVNIQNGGGDNGRPPPDDGNGNGNGDDDNGNGQPPSDGCSTNSDCRREAPYEICFVSQKICLRGDVNNDSSIDMNDFEEFVQDFISFKENGWGTSLRRSDFNQDSRISMADYSIFVNSYRLVRGLN